MSDGWSVDCFVDCSGDRPVDWSEMSSVDGLELGWANGVETAGGANVGADMDAAGDSVDSDEAMGRMGAADRADRVDASAPSGAEELEQRVDERYSINGDAEVMVAGGNAGALMLRGRILNISSSGCYVQTIAWRSLAPGTQVDLQLMVRGWLVGAKAESRFSMSKVGMGFRFLKMDAESQEKLDRFVGLARERIAERVAEEKARAGDAAKRAEKAQVAKVEAAREAELKKAGPRPVNPFGPNGPDWIRR